MYEIKSKEDVEDLMMEYIDTPDLIISDNKNYWFIQVKNVTREEITKYLRKQKKRFKFTYRIGSAAMGKVDFFIYN